MFVTIIYYRGVMKKILMVMIMTVGLLACSADNEGDSVQYGNGVLQKTNAEGQTEALTTTSCFTSLTGNVHLDVSNGIGNPTVVFTPVITGTVSPTARFIVRVEVQPLSNCDDMNSNTGTLLSFGPVDAVKNVGVYPPVISVLPSSLPLCYKWRFVFESSPGTIKASYCYSTSSWYESPLF
jgi:hypothetical protein